MDDTQLQKLLDEVREIHEKKHVFSENDYLWQNLLVILSSAFGFILGLALGMYLEAYIVEPALLGISSTVMFGFATWLIHRRYVRRRGKKRRKKQRQRYAELRTQREAAVRWLERRAKSSYKLVNPSERRKLRDDLWAMDLLQQTF